MKKMRLGIHGLIRLAICAAVLLVLAAFTFVSYQNVTREELSRAEECMNDELTYLRLQLELLDSRASAFDRLVSSSGAEPQEAESSDPSAYRILSDPVGDVLSGYTLVENGTVAIIANDNIVSTNDGRLAVGSPVKQLLGVEVCEAIDASLQSGEIQTIPYRGVFDQPAGEGAYGNDDEEAYLLAMQQGDFIVLEIEPSSMVFMDRVVIIAREVTGVFIILTVVFLILDRLLDCLVLQRIDKTNEALGRIISGELDTRVDEVGTREFVSLASGINATVETLQGWIAEAETRMDSELAAARAIQESALPCTFPPYPDIQKFDIYAIMNAAKEVGGDFYDIFLIGDGNPDSGKLAFLIADVSGKGIPAALFMMKAMTQVRKELQSGAEIGLAIQNANRELSNGNTSCMFVTMWVGVLDYGTGRLEYLNAGHNPTLFWRDGEGWVWLTQRSGIPLGTPIDRAYSPYSIDCCAGDKFLLYTDGVTEGKNEADEMYRENRLMEVADANQSKRPEALVTAIRADLASFVQEAEQFDDITILALEVL